MQRPAGILHLTKVAPSDANIRRLWGENCVGGFCRALCPSLWCPENSPVATESLPLTRNVRDLLFERWHVS